MTFEQWRIKGNRVCVLEGVTRCLAAEDALALLAAFLRRTWGGRGRRRKQGREADAVDRRQVQAAAGEGAGVAVVQEEEEEGVGVAAVIGVGEDVSEGGGEYWRRRSDEDDRCEAGGRV